MQVSLNNFMFLTSTLVINTYFYSRPFNTEHAFEKAKSNVENEYSVVGILEDLETTLTVFEQYIPRFFAGAVELYKENNALLKNANRNSRPQVSQEVKDMLRENFSYEYKFYEFCKKRLYTQFIAANKLNKN